MHPKRTILLTGATGFLGSNLLSRFVRDGHSVVALRRPTSDLFRIAAYEKQVRFFDFTKAPLARVFRENEIQVIVHCATNYGRRAVPPTEIIEANLTLPLQLLELAEEHGVQSFINSDTVLDKRVNHYSLSKKQFVEWLELFSKKLVCANVALEHFYGPLDDSSKFVTKVLLDLIQEVEEIPLTPGRQRRDFIHIEDVVEAYARILDFCAGSPCGLYRFEVGTERTIEIREFVELAKELVGNKRTALTFGALPYRENEVMDSKVDTAPLRRLGWEPRIELREGLRRTIEQERKRRV